MTDEGKVYVGSLPFDVDDAQLREMFSKYGEITDAHIVYEKDNPSQSRGFGFVTFTSNVYAQAAIDGLDETPLGHRYITVKFAGKQDSGGSRGGRGRGGSYSDRGGYGGDYGGVVSSDMGGYGGVAPTDMGGYGGVYGGGESLGRGGHRGGYYSGRGSHRGGSYSDRGGHGGDRNDWY